MSLHYFKTLSDLIVYAHQCLLCLIKNKIYKRYIYISLWKFYEVSENSHWFHQSFICTILTYNRCCVRKNSTQTYLVKRVSQLAVLYTIFVRNRLFCLLQNSIDHNCAVPALCLNHIWKSSPFVPLQQPSLLARHAMRPYDAKTDCLDLSLFLGCFFKYNWLHFGGSQSLASALLAKLNH